MLEDFLVKIHHQRDAFNQSPAVLTDKSDLDEARQNSSESSNEVNLIKKQSWNLPAIGTCNFSRVHRQNHHHDSRTESLEEPRDVNRYDVVCEDEDEKGGDEEQRTEQQRPFPSDGSWKRSEKNRPDQPSDRQKTSNPRELLIWRHKIQRRVGQKLGELCDDWRWPSDGCSPWYPDDVRCERTFRWLLIFSASPQTILTNNGGQNLIKLLLSRGLHERLGFSAVEPQIKRNPIESDRFK